MRSKVKIAQKGIEARKRKRLTWAGILWLALALVVFFGLAWLSHLDFMSLSVIDVSGNTRIQSETIRTIANEKLSGNYIGLFSRNNAFLYPRRAIRNAVAALPAAKSVDVDRSWLKKIEINVVEREEDARWCSDGEGDIALDGRDVGCFSVDENGLIFDRSSTRTVIAYRGEPMGEPEGKQVAPSEDFRRMQFFVRELGKLGVDPREVWFKDAGYIDVLLGQGGRLIVNTSDDLSTTLLNLAAVLSDRSIASSTTAFLSSLDYMRLDSGNKVFYKLKP
ncbi:MAG: FtsQ-type POTRA domain-containing protein [bacterium]|nr:FtsQ-type POTRA domain-containing protein [bacterium]